MTDKQIKTNRQILLGAGGAVSLAAFTVQPVNAQSTASASITQMQTDATAIGSLASAIIPIAVGSIVFGAAALLFKRYIYS